MPFFQADNLRVELASDGIAQLWLDVRDRPLNVFNRQVLADLGAALDRVAAESSARLLVVRSAKPSGFLAGADLHEFTAVRSADDAAALSARGQDLFAKVANLRVPVVAVIHGVCLGGGLEFALACDYRLVLDQNGTQLALPEIKLGLLPGWGGTQRLPRVVGLEKSLEMILGSRPVSAQEAVRCRLADALAGSEGELPEELERLTRYALSRGKLPKNGLPKHTWRQRLVESNLLGWRLIFGGTERRLRRRVPDDMPAPYEALEAVRTGLMQGPEAGFAREREAIGRLAMTPACRNLVGVFFAREQARKLSAEAKRQVTERVRRVGVVGAGTMGAGIAQLAALRGAEVVIQEVNEAALGAGILKVNALFHKAAERGLLTDAERRQRLAAVKGTVTWEGFADADLVIEAALEDLEVKRALFAEMEEHTRPSAILATNTSSLSVGALQEGLSHPERVAALHFFNPVHKMELVEVGRTPRTSAETVSLLRDWAILLGKTPVVVKDSPGFVVNRILMPYLNEAVLLVGEGMPVEEIDRVMHRFGMPMGPLELLDQVGLDVAAHIARAMGPLFGDRFPPNRAFEQMVEHGWLGHKRGWGFYRYQRKGKKVNEAAVELLRQGVSGVSAWEARERMVLGMVNEAAACVGEGLTDRAEAIDLAMILGTGWAPHRGGPLHYADARGPAEVAAALGELARRLGPRFEPSAELRRHAETGQPFCEPVAQE
ncbi:MAG TPA: 3-hydroxyacyl-CoA dehydrogenase NAD-binding domain-containing protein [Gemmataceae bacterium]|nr:3-hydroxyacyl-CoA dehydrogenase NAD-binding domain-containing protein [Gemmataceae bacterium]